MEQIIEQLKEWAENIECDLCKDYYSQDEKSRGYYQSNKIHMAIGLLQSVGKNNNIPEKSKIIIK